MEMVIAVPGAIHKIRAPIPLPKALKKVDWTTITFLFQNLKKELNVKKNRYISIPDPFMFYNMTTSLNDIGIATFFDGEDLHTCFYNVQWTSCSCSYSTGSKSTHQVGI
jgi:hypothetical protein